MTSHKAVPMTKDEALLLVQLVIANGAINNKATNATNNKMKEEAWKILTKDFNSSITSFPRTPAQLRLKWENLKKSARKRCANMKSSLNKTGGGKAFFAPDELLDQVASVLGNTCTGFTVEYGGDAVELNGVVVGNVEITEECIVGQEVTFNASGDGANFSGDGTSSLKENNFHTPTSQNKSFYFGKASGSGSLAKRKHKLEEDKSKARIQRDSALAEYLLAKKKKIEIENEEKEINFAKLKLELEKAKIELENVKVELDNAKLENLRLKNDLNIAD